MTLEEFSEKLFSTGGSWTVCYCYDSEEALDERCHRGNPEPLFCLCSAYRPGVYLRSKYAKAVVRGFVALDRDTLGIWIEEEPGERQV